SAIVAVLILLIVISIKQYRRAEARQLTAWQNSYASEMLLAAEEIRADNRGNALDLLNQSRPSSGEKDLRSWEWRYLWGQCRSDELFTLGKHDLEVFSLAVLPQNRLLSAGFDRQIRMWNLADRTLLATNKLLGGVSGIAVPADGSYIAAGYWK